MIEAPDQLTVAAKYECRTNENELRTIDGMNVSEEMDGYERRIEK